MCFKVCFTCPSRFKEKIKMNLLDNVTPINLKIGKEIYRKRQDYISLVSHSPSCLHKSRARVGAYTVGKGKRRTALKRKSTVYTTTSYFGRGRGPEGIPSPLDLQKPLKSHPHYSFWDSILNTLIWI